MCNLKKPIVAARLAALVLFILLIRAQALLIWLLLYALSLLSPALLGKRLYCVVLCPIHTVMMGVQWLKKRQGVKPKPAPAWAQGKWLPWVMLVLTAALFFLTRGRFNKPLPVMLLWIAVAAMMTWHMHPDAFHDGTCPYGAPQRALAEMSLLNEENRRAARDYKGFTQTVLGSAAGNEPQQKE